MDDNRVYRSVSQYNQYVRCPYSYKLSRIDKVWQRPAAWLPQGSAVHEAIEAWEKSKRTMPLAEVQQIYSEAYDRYTNEFCDETPNFAFWFRSGPYAPATDVRRRYGIGMEQVAKYLAWYEKHPEQAIWIAPDGTPGIELGFDMQLDEIWLRGFIDAVIWMPGMAGDNDDGSPRPYLAVRDAKTGKSPGDDFQLGVYAVVLAEQYGLDPILVGDYWMGDSGKPTVPYPLDDWPREAVVEAFRWLNEQIEAERFEPKPEPDKCRFCDVAASCSFAMG